MVNLIFPGYIVKANCRLMVHIQGRWVHKQEKAHARQVMGGRVCPYARPHTHAEPHKASFGVFPRMMATALRRAKRAWGCLRVRGVCELATASTPLCRSAGKAVSHAKARGVCQSHPPLCSTAPPTGRPVHRPSISICTSGINFFVCSSSLTNTDIQGKCIHVRDPLSLLLPLHYGVYLGNPHLSAHLSIGKTPPVSPMVCSDYISPEQVVRLNPNFMLNSRVALGIRQYG